MKLIEHFICYINNNLELSKATRSIYTHDAHEFYTFLMSNTWHLENFTPNYIQAYKNTLEKKRVGTAIARRKLVVIRLLCKFLHEQHTYPDYSTSPVFALVEHTLPILCPVQVLSTLKKQNTQNYTTLSWQELRNQLLIELLLQVPLTVAQVVTLQKSNFCFKTHIVQFVTPKGTHKRFDITQQILDLLEYYLSVLPYSSDYIFCVKVNQSIKPLSRQAAWALIKTLVQEPRSRMLPKSHAQPITDEIRLIYKKHPRA